MKFTACTASFRDVFLSGHDNTRLHFTRSNTLYHPMLTGIISGSVTTVDVLHAFTLSRNSDYLILSKYVELNPDGCIVISDI